MFYKTVFRHLGEPELFDCISSDYIGSPLPLCLLKYSFDGLERSFAVASHGNSKGRIGYTRTINLILILKFIEFPRGIFILNLQDYKIEKC